MARYNILYDTQAVDELKRLRRRDQVNILGAIERHLMERPARVSRVTIKKLNPPVLASYRLRVGDYRVFYDVDAAGGTVHVIAVRLKGGKTLREAADGEDS